MGRALVLGIGNTLRRDDGAGIAVVRAMKKKFIDDERVGFAEGMGLEPEHLMGYEMVFIVDAIADERVKPGELVKIDVDSIPGGPYLAHGGGVGEVIEWAQNLGIDLPWRIEVFGVGVEDCAGLGEGLTPKVHSAVERCAERLARRVRACLRLSTYRCAVMHNQLRI